MTGGRLTFSRLVDPYGKLMDDALALYEQAIPARERKSAAAIRRMAAEGPHHIVAALDPAGLVGFYVLSLGNMISLLEYMAVDEERRGAGVGAQLYNHARQAAGRRPLLVEVDSDLEPSPDQDIRARRISFYRRLGCRRLIGLDYRMPLPGFEPAPSMALLVDGLPEAEEVLASQVEGWLIDIYEAGYQAPPNHPLLRLMRRSLPPRVRLG